MPIFDTKFKNNPRLKHWKNWVMTNKQCTGCLKKRSKSYFFINAEIIISWIQYLDQSSIYLMSKRGPKDISIA